MGSFRVYHDMLEDYEIHSLSPAMFRFYFHLKCVFSKYGGKLADIDDARWCMRIKSEAKFRRQLEILENAGLIFINEGGGVSIAVRPYEDMRPPAHVWKAARERIFERDNYTCAYCGERGGKLECDHIIPVARGGTHDDANLTTACFPCNRSKRDKTVEEWRGQGGTHSID
jgi:hypothetical protein